MCRVCNYRSGGENRSIFAHDGRVFARAAKIKLVPWLIVSRSGIYLSGTLILAPPAKSLWPGPLRPLQKYLWEARRFLQHCIIRHSISDGHSEAHGMWGEYAFVFHQQTLQLLYSNCSRLNNCNQKSPSLGIDYIFLKHSLYFIGAWWVMFWLLMCVFADRSWTCIRSVCVRQADMMRLRLWHER